MNLYKSTPRNILVLSRYDSLGASSRVRIFQYLPYLESNINFTVSPFFSNRIINDLYNNKKRSIVLLFISYFRRFKILLSIFKYDIVWIEKEIFPFFPGFLEMLFIPKRTKYFLDYDDAIFHNYDFDNNFILKLILKNKFEKIIGRADKVFVGNQYLYDYANRWNKNVFYLYSVVNENIYRNLNKQNANKFTIGWIGSPSTTKYLQEIIYYINQIPKRDKIRLITIGASNLINANFDLVQLEWKLEDEVDYINLFDVGIMPLQDNNWEKGKCGFKLIQYMACSLPVIASPIGINKEIVSGDVGFLAKDKNEWIDAILLLMENSDIRKSFGINGRKKIEKNFSFFNNVKILSSSFNFS